MTDERIKEAIEAWQVLSDEISASSDMDWVLNKSDECRRFICYDDYEEDESHIWWCNVDDIISVQVILSKDSGKFKISPYIEIVDPETGDWDGENYNVESYRVCDHCGALMHEGYFLNGEYACSDECAIELYNGNETQLRADLDEEAEDLGSTDCFYTEWY